MTYKRFALLCQIWRRGANPSLPCPLPLADSAWPPVDSGFPFCAHLCRVRYAAQVWQQQQHRTSYGRTGQRTAPTCVDVRSSWSENIQIWSEFLKKAPSINHSVVSFVYFLASRYGKVKLLTPEITSTPLMRIERLVSRIFSSGIWVWCFNRSYLSQIEYLPAFMFLFKSIKLILFQITSWNLRKESHNSGAKIASQISTPSIFLLRSFYRLCESD